MVSRLRQQRPPSRKFVLFAWSVYPPVSSLSCTLSVGAVQRSSTPNRSSSEGVVASVSAGIYTTVNQLKAEIGGPRPGSDMRSGWWSSGTCAKYTDACAAAYVGALAARGRFVTSWAAGPPPPSLPPPPVRPRRPKFRVACVGFESALDLHMRTPHRSIFLNQPLSDSVRSLVTPRLRRQNRIVLRR